MNFDLIVSNITNPAFLFFILGIIAVKLKSDLEIPPNSSKFISLYLLFSIGFKGGQELSHESFNAGIVLSVLFGILLAVIIPLYVFFLIKRKFNVYDSAAIASTYGSVSAVTFVTAVSYLEMNKSSYEGHMVAIMALMEFPAIITGFMLISLYTTEQSIVSKRKILSHGLTNSSVFLILGCLIIGCLASAQQAEGIKPFTTDIFKGFLAIFLLDLGINTGKKIGAFFAQGIFPLLIAIIIPLFNGCMVAGLSQFVTASPGNRFLFAILAASASYIAVPAAMKLANPKSNSGLYVPMALAITFPINITIGMPIYYFIAS